MTFIIILIASMSLCLADPPPFKPGDRQVEPPVGKLGYPIGTYLTIEGVQLGDQKGSPKILEVDSINGYKLDQPIGIRVEHFELPANERCVIRGYETGEWIGQPIEPRSVVILTNGNIEVSTGQTPWQFAFYFRATSLEQPKDLKVK